MELIKAHYNLSKRVEKWGEVRAQAKELVRFMNDSKATFNGREAMALSHCQVSDKPWAFFVVNEWMVKQKILPSQIIINPFVRIHYGPEVPLPEGCMTFPYRKAKNVPRHLAIKAEFSYPTATGALKTVWMEFQDTVAQMFQHECQHHLGQNIYFNGPKV